MRKDDYSTLNVSLNEYMEGLTESPSIIQIERKVGDIDIKTIEDFSVEIKDQDLTGVSLCLLNGVPQGRDNISNAFYDSVAYLKEF